VSNGKNNSGHVPFSGLAALLHPFSLLRLLGELRLPVEGNVVVDMRACISIPHLALVFVSSRSDPNSPRICFNDEICICKERSLGSYREHI
jgi:hypothetical protein